jgi:lipopolysaccharide export system protein LptC
MPIYELCNDNHFCENHRVSQIGELLDEELHAPARRLSLTRVSLLAGIGGFCVLVLYVTFYWGSDYTPTQTSSDGDRIDFYLNTATNKTFNEEGGLASIITSPRAEFFQKQQVGIFATPAMDIRRTNGEQWLIKAEKGLWKEADEQLTLTGKVNASRTPSPMTIESEKMIAWPKTRKAETDLAVTIRTPEGILRAIGMQADLDAERIEFLEDVRGHYDAR